MPRTAEQKAADDQLTEAIELVRRAYEDDPGFSDRYLLTDYIVLFAAQRFDEEGEGWTMVGHCYRDGDIPAYRIVGLLDFALTRVRKIVAEDED